MSNCTKDNTMNAQTKIKPENKELKEVSERQKRKEKALDNLLALSYLIKDKSTIEEILECRDEGRR
jgi:hypothetical protein